MNSGSPVISDALLSVDEVAFSYGGIPALRGVSLGLRGGEAVALVGSNGAGKTTLAKVIAGLLTPSAGAVSADGHAISGLRSHRIPRHGIAIVLEGRHVFATQSVRSNLELGAFWRRLSRAEMDSELERTLGIFPDLRQHIRRPAGALSGGQQQMLAVGRALMGAPRLLVLDEPSMGLSPKLAGEVYDALASLRTSGLGILLIEQNANLAFELCERGYVIQYGRIVLAGGTGDLRQADLVRRIYLGSEAIAV